MKRFHIELCVALIASAFGALACAPNQSATPATTKSSTALGAASSTLTGGGSSSTGSTSFSIQQFTPASSTVSVLPTTVQLAFSESTIDTVSATQASNYTLTCGSTIAHASGVTLASNIALVTLPTLANIPGGTSCTFSVAAGVRDNAGNGLSGVRSVVYSLQGSAVVTDTTPPIGSITAPAIGARVTSSVTLSATATDQGSNPSGVASVEFDIDGVAVGIAKSAPYQISVNTSALSNGQHTLTISVTDVAGNVASIVDSRQFTVANYDYSLSPSTGGTGGTAWSDPGPDGANLMGFYIHAGSYINQITPVYGFNTNGSVSYKYGGTYGGTGGTQNGFLLCPAGSAVVGLWGHSGSYVDAMGLICGTLDGSGQTSYQPNLAGGYGGSPYEIRCQAGTFAVSVIGRAGSYIDQIQLGCQ